MITLSINRIKKEDEIWEIFTVNPKTPYNFDSHRAIYFELWLQRNLHSIHDTHKLLKVLELNDKVIYTYKYSDINVTKNELVTIKYFPVLGKKTCKKCFHEIKIDNKLYCHKKGKQNDKNSWYKCLYWQEKSLDNRI